MDLEKYRAGESTLIHEDVVAFVNGKMPDEEPIYEVLVARIGFSCAFLLNVEYLSHTIAVGAA